MNNDITPMDKPRSYLVDNSLEQTIDNCECTLRLIAAVDLENSDLGPLAAFALSQIACHVADNLIYVREQMQIREGELVNQLDRLKGLQASPEYLESQLQHVRALKMESQRATDIREKAAGEHEKLVTEYGNSPDDDIQWDVEPSGGRLTLPTEDDCQVMDDEHNKLCHKLVAAAGLEQDDEIPEFPLMKRFEDARAEYEAAKADLQKLRDLSID